MDSTAVSTTSVTLRRATPADIPAIRRIEHQSFPNPWPDGAFERHLDAAAFFVAETDAGQVIGYVLADQPITQGTAVGHLKNIAVAPAYRANGIGRRLLERALAELALTGVFVVSLEVREGNTAARHLYEQFGFKRVGREANYYDNGDAAILMLREL